jgi:hypothetical protein
MINFGNILSDAKGLGSRINNKVLDYNEIVTYSYKIFENLEDLDYYIITTPDHSLVYKYIPFLRSTRSLVVKICKTDQLFKENEKMRNSVIDIIIDKN